MQCFVLAVCLLLAGPSAGATLSSVQKQREHLLPFLNSLADALRQDFIETPGILDERDVIAGMERNVEEEKAARKRLEMEAERLASEGGRGSKLAASLLRSLARRRDMAETTQIASPVVSQSSISESTISTDENGHSRMLRKVKRCKGGVCQEYTQSSSPEIGADQEKSSQQTEKPTSNKAGKNLNAVKPQADDDIFNAVNAFRGLDDSMEFDDGFTAPDIFGLNDDFWNRFRGPAPHRQGIAKGAQAFKSSGPASSAEDSEAFQNSQSISSQTIMKNGKLVRQTTRCKNGKCKTIVEQGSLVPGSQTSGESQAKQQRTPAAADAETVLQKGPEW